MGLHTGCSMLTNENGVQDNIVSNDKGDIPDKDENNDQKEKDSSHKPNPGNQEANPILPPEKQPDSNKPTDDQPAATDSDQSKEDPLSKEPEKHEDKPDSSNDFYESIQVVGQPEAITVLVNKQNKLPNNYAPKDLVFPDVPFIFNEKSDKRKLRKVAANALETLFAGAKEDGILLAGVSGYRSEATQVGLYNSYVKRDGKAAADRYSARPGHSEHQTGLTMDISGTSGKCAAQDCFGGTPEAKWVAKHAYEYGFIIRYPEGKEQITGYQYEPWHLRYVGTDIAKVIHENGITLEEYFHDTVPVGGEN